MVFFHEYTKLCIILLIDRKSVLQGWCYSCRRTHEWRRQERTRAEEEDAQPQLSMVRLHARFYLGLWRRSSPRRCLLFDGVRDRGWGWPGSIEDHGVTVFIDCPSHKNEERVGPLSKARRCCVGGGLPPVEEPSVSSEGVVGRQYRASHHARPCGRARNP